LTLFRMLDAIQGNLFESLECEWVPRASGS
jgi:hypothetical protein